MREAADIDCGRNSGTTRLFPYYFSPNGTYPDPFFVDDNKYLGHNS